MHDYAKIELDLCDEYVLKLCLLAHEKDVTLNEFVLGLLEDYMEKDENR